MDEINDIFKFKTKQLKNIFLRVILLIKNMLSHAPGKWFSYESMKFNVMGKPVVIGKVVIKQF